MRQLVAAAPLANTFPTQISSTSDGSIPALSITALKTCVTRSSRGVLRNTPRIALPRAVRVTDTITTSSSAGADTLPVSDRKKKTDSLRRV